MSHFRCRGISAVMCCTDYCRKHYICYGQAFGVCSCGFGVHGVAITASAQKLKLKLCQTATALPSAAEIAKESLTPTRKPTTHTFKSWVVRRRIHHVFCTFFAETANKTGWLVKQGKENELAQECQDQQMCKASVLWAEMHAVRLKFRSVGSKKQSKVNLTAYGLHAEVQKKRKRLQPTHTRVTQDQLETSRPERAICAKLPERASFSKSWRSFSASRRIFKEPLVFVHINRLCRFQSTCWLQRWKKLDKQIEWTAA